MLLIASQTRPAFSLNFVRVCVCVFVNECMCVWQKQIVLLFRNRSPVDSGGLSFAGCLLGVKQTLDQSARTSNTLHRTINTRDRMVKMNAVQHVWHVLIPCVIYSVPAHTRWYFFYLWYCLFDKLFLQPLPQNSSSKLRNTNIVELKYFHARIRHKLDKLS